MIDEIRLSSSGEVLHEILFSTGLTWRIECATILHSTTAPENSIEIIMS